MDKLTELAAWQALKQHHQLNANHSMQEWFEADPLRFSQFSLTFGDILFDFSKNRIDQQTISLLTQLARDINLSDSIHSLFAGHLINSTEKRPALHTALRDRNNTCLLLNNHNIMQDIHAMLEKMHQFTNQVRDGTWRGATGKSIRDIVNIGIGGSHLGPMMVTHALSDYANKNLRCYFISNVDGAQINDVLQQIDPERTLFIISSKSFTTIETISNAEVIRDWLQTKLGTDTISSHFVAVTAVPSRAREFGIPETQIFSIWDWVGGRYSVWSAIGLPIALLIGMENFYEFLDGAHDIDAHFKEAPFSENIPVLMGLLGIWYINFFDCSTQAIISYSHELNFFRDYIQQTDMESNGKAVSRADAFIDYVTGPIIIGQQGCDSQHSFFQLLHQGPRMIPVDFILLASTKHFEQQQDILVASALSQAKALMHGKSYAEALSELRAAGYTETDAEHLAIHKTIPGNRPSNTFFIKKLTPRVLGSLIALYEHKIFVQGIIWGINSFDQWGVELGKQLLSPILEDFKQAEIESKHDSSTLGLIQYYVQSRNSV
jgi:glucose-6-phosphate isomerase